MDGEDVLLDKHFKSERVGVSWIDGELVLVNGKPGKGMIGICHKTKQIRGLGTTLDSLIVRNVYVDEKTCEDGYYCLDFSCPLNKASVVSLKRQYKDKMPKLFWERIEQKIKDKKPMIEFDPDIIKDMDLSKDVGVILVADKHM